MSKCEACGGDGLIEYGAYRGDESSETRTCVLCGGVRAEVVALPEGLPRLMSSRNGMREVVAAPHVHRWKQPEKFGPYIRFGCHDCSKGLVFSENGSLQDGETPNPFVLDELSRKAIVFAARQVHAGQAAQYKGETFLNTGPQSWNPADVAREYAQRLNAENERRQREAESNLTTFTDEHGATRSIRPLVKPHA